MLLSSFKIHEKNYTTHDLELGAVCVLQRLKNPRDIICIGTKSVIYMDHKSLQHIFSQKGKANVLANALSRKERVNPKRVRAINMTLQSRYKGIDTGGSKRLKAEHKAPSGLLQQPEIPVWKWEGIAMDFVTKLSRTSSGHDTIWVIVGRLTKSAHFLPMSEDYKMDRLARLYLNDKVARHGVMISIISDHDSRFTSRFF
ncbi:putative reverse transcriptase domain-containing protein [Tanacetum coccineum]